MKTKPLTFLLALTFLFLFIGSSVVFGDDLQDANDALERKDYETAFRLFSLFAEQGNAKAQYNLGLLYDKGQGVSQNTKEAFKWLRLAVEQGYASAQNNLGWLYERGKGVPQDYKEALRLYRLSAEQGYAESQLNLGLMYYTGRGVLQDYKEAFRLWLPLAEQGDAKAQNNLGVMYEKGQGVPQDYKEALRLYRLSAEQGFATGQNNLGVMYEKGQGVPQDYVFAHMWWNLAGSNGDEQASKNRKLIEKQMSPQQIAQAQQLVRNWKPTNRIRVAASTNPVTPKQQAQAKKEPSPQSGSGSGFFVSKMGHVITNAHVVQNCKNITIGDNANKQVPAELINTDRSNDLALLKLSTLEMASAESKSLIQKLSIVVVPLASKGLLRSDDVKLGEKVLVAGYPFGELFSNTIKVTSGIVSATRGAGDDSGQFQLDAAVQPGNSGGPIYDSGGNIVGVVVAQLDKLKMAKAIGSLPENVNFGIKASTVRQFLMSSGLPSKKSERTEEKSTEQLAEIAKNQALMVMCLQTESFEHTAESIAEERKNLKKERERIAALQSLQEEKQKLEEERRLFKEEQDRLVRLQPKKHISTTPPEYNRALHSYRSGRYDECILLLQRLLSDNPPERLKDSINYWIGSSFSKLEMYEDAIEILQSVLLKNPTAELQNKILKRLNEIDHE